MNQETSNVPSGAAVACSALLDHQRPTTEQINRQWEELQEARRQCPALNAYFRAWNRRAEALRKLEAAEVAVKRAAEAVPDEYKQHM